MHLWVEIAARELAALGVLFALGIGPASFLAPRFDAAARAAIAPVLGLCVGTCAFTTLIWFTAAGNTYWLIPVLAVASIAVAMRRGLAASVDGRSDDAASRARGLRRVLLVPLTVCKRLPARDAVALVIVCVVVAAPLSYTLHERDSVGPTGYLVLDTVGYTATADGMEQLSLREALRPAPEDVNFVHYYWTGVAKGAVNIDASPLAANLELLIGLHATDTQSLFLIAILVAGGLGAFAAVRYLVPKPSWAAPVGGALFGGPLFLQLLADGSQAATCGLTVLMPLAVLAIETLREQRPANLVVLALLASGLMALYPLYFPAVAFAGALVLGAIALTRRAHGRLSWRSVRRAALLLAGAAALTIVFDLVAFTRDLRYWAETIGGENLAGKPIYDLPLAVIPGWVLQTRQFYVLQSPPLFYLPKLTQAPFVEVLGETILPAVLIAVILFGLWRNRRGLVFVAIIAVFAALAEYGSAAHGCSYCVDRDTLPSAPTSIVLLMLGLGALATGSRRWMRWSAVGIAAAAVIAVGAQTWTERELFAAEAFYLSGPERTVVSDLPSDPGWVDLEGFGENAELEGAIPELELMYTLAYERNHGKVSVPSEFFNYNSLAYFGGPNTRNPRFNPRYRYVITRLGGVETGRRVLARDGPLALEERGGPLDLTVTTGLALPMVREEGRGQPSVVGTLHFLLVGGGSAPAWALLRFRTIAPAQAVPRAGVLSRASPHELVVCARATGQAPAREVAVALEGTLYVGVTPSERFALPEPPQGVTLVAMRAVDHCTP